MELHRVRIKRRFLPDDLTVPSLLTGQTVRNTEGLIHSPRLFTLALHCERLGTTLEWLLPSAVGRWGSADGRIVIP